MEKLEHDLSGSTVLSVGRHVVVYEKRTKTRTGYLYHTISIRDKKGKM